MYIEKLETKDLILKKATVEDAEIMFKNYWSDKETAKYMLWRPLDNVEEAYIKMEKTIKHQADNLAFLVYEKSSMEPIGMAGFIKIEDGVYEDTGIGIGSKFTRKGYGTQILEVLIDYIFNDLKAKKILYSCFRENVASHRLALKFDFNYLFTIADVREWDQLEYAVDYYQMLNPNQDL